MDVHRPGEGGRPGIVEPPVVGLPTVGRRDQHHLAAALVVQRVLGPVVAGQHFRDAGLGAEQVGHPGCGLRLAVGREHVRKLVVGQGKGAARLQVEVLAVVLVAHGQQPRLAQHAVGIRHVLDRDDGVLAGHQPYEIVAVGRAEALGQAPDRFIQLADGPEGGLAVGPGPLGGVLQVWQVDVEEVGPELLGRVHRRIDDPRRRRDAGHRAPEVLQGEVPQRVPQGAVKLLRLRIAPE